MDFVVFVGIFVLFIWGGAALGARQRARMPAGGAVRPAGGARSQGCVPLAAGIIIIVVVVVIGIPMLRRAQSDLAFAQGNPPVPQLAAAQVGKTVLLQGAVSPQTPAVRWNFVAFDRYERRNRRSRLAESHRPPFKIAVPGQHIQIENPAEPAGAEYRIENQAYHPESTNIRGLLANDRVLAVGTVRSGRNGLYLDAAEIYRGDYAGYLAFLRGSISQNGMTNIAMAGAICVCVALYVAARRKAARSGLRP